MPALVGEQQIYFVNTPELRTTVKYQELIMHIYFLLEILGKNGMTDKLRIFSHKRMFVIYFVETEYFVVTTQITRRCSIVCIMIERKHEPVSYIGNIIYRDKGQSTHFISS